MVQTIEKFDFLNIKKVALFVHSILLVLFYQYRKHIKPLAPSITYISIHIKPSGFGYSKQDQNSVTKD